MDTDDFSELSRGIIVRAAQISDTLKAELGALSGRYKNEDDWLRGVKKHLQRIIEDPDEYVDFWNLGEEEGITATTIRNLASGLGRQADEVLSRPLDQRSQ
jgi:hypothetical protein